MIPIRRPRNTRAIKALQASQKANLPIVESSVANGTFKAKDIDSDSYKPARHPLFEAQHKKCCYCEYKVVEKGNAVEHFRPKSVYWWVTWSWENLLFVCKRCNSAKGDQFPLFPPAYRLKPKGKPPGKENPILLNPANSKDDPLASIQFRLNPQGVWLPFARNGDPRGFETIKAMKLDDADLHDLYKSHALNLESPIRAIRAALNSNDTARIKSVWDQETRVCLSISQPFTALSRDILAHYISESERSQYGLLLDLRPAL